MKRRRSPEDGCGTKMQRKSPVMPSGRSGLFLACSENTIRIGGSGSGAGRDLLYKDFICVLLSQGDDGTADEIGSHAAVRSLQDTGKDFIRGEAQIQQPLLHVRLAGKPDHTNFFTGFYMT